MQPGYKRKSPVIRRRCTMEKSYLKTLHQRGFLSMGSFFCYFFFFLFFLLSLGCKQQDIPAENKINGLKKAGRAGTFDAVTLVKRATRDDEDGVDLSSTLQRCTCTTKQEHKRPFMKNGVWIFHSIESVDGFFRVFSSFFFSFHFFLLQSQSSPVFIVCYSRQ